MIRRYNNLSFLFFLPGIVAQFVGVRMIANGTPASSLDLVGVGLILLGTVLAITGFGYYAKAKGRSPVWGIAGFVGLPGLLLLGILKDCSGDPWNT